MNTNLTNLYTFISGATATGVGIPMNVADYQNIIISVASSGSAAFTIKFQGSIATVSPIWSP